MKPYPRLEWALGFLSCLLLWYLAVDCFALVNPILLPPLKEVVLRLSELLTNGSLARDFLATIQRWTLGFGLGASLGITAGLVLGVTPRLYRILEGPLEFLRAMPVTAIFPLFLMIFGLGDASKIAMAFLPTFLLLLINASYGVFHASLERRRAVQIFGATPWQIFRYVVFFESLPQIFIGLRLALSLSLIVTVVSEMFIGTDTGLGQRIYDSYLTNSVTTLYALLLVLGLVGYVLNKISLSFEKRLVFWAGRA
jgi:ABC-type nitrate/sulfonate/bicarbonate transport system permease component